MEYTAEACGCGALQVERDYGWTMFEGPHGWQLSIDDGTRSRRTVNDAKVRIGWGRRCRRIGGQRFATRKNTVP